jgi:hypothetical protein
MKPAAPTPSPLLHLPFLQALTVAVMLVVARIFRLRFRANGYHCESFPTVDVVIEALSNISVPASPSSPGANPGSKPQRNDATPLRP